MADNDKKILPIDYTHREFESIRGDLMQIAQRFYPDSFRDFSDASFGSLMLDAVAYVGDQLNFYLDYNINESFLDTAYGADNILRHGRALGYKSSGVSSVYGEVALYAMVPAHGSGLGPDPLYTPIMKRGSRFSSKNGLNFILTSNIDFSNPANPIVVGRVDDSTGAPTHYAIKAYGNVVSGKFSSRRLKVGNFQRFNRVKISSRQLAEVISVFDLKGNQYYEVDYLSQDMVYEEIPNDNYKSDNVPSVIKPLLVSRKFIIVRNDQGTFLQFGSGDSSESAVVADPQRVALNLFGKSYVTDTTFDPTRLSRDTSYGIVPANTTLTVNYRLDNKFNSNVATGVLNGVQDAVLEFKDREQLTVSKMADIQSSIEVLNETPLVGVNSAGSVNELKAKIMDTFPTQNRAVTQADYENVALRMPGKFGSVKRVSVQKDPDSLKRNLNMYVISENHFGKLTATNSTIKQNLKTWLNNYRMINDTIDILDPYIVNVGIEFVIKVLPTADRNLAITQSITRLKRKFARNYFIGEHIQISDIYSELKRARDVLDVIKVKIISKSGGQYSYVNFSINENLSPEGDYLMCPKNAIFEIKFPSVDIKGKTR
tara:strand:+ start:16926 stop:18722 length:1797 start_codon:yes stop_codon:yes gene_type:complete